MHEDVQFAVEIAVHLPQQGDSLIRIRKLSNNVAHEAGGGIFLSLGIHQASQRFKHGQQPSNAVVVEPAFEQVGNVSDQQPGELSR
jgi:hypothetical protein